MTTCISAATISYCGHGVSCPVSLNCVGKSCFDRSDNHYEQFIYFNLKITGNYGILGNGDTTDLLVPPESPIDLGDDFAVEVIDCGYRHCCGVSSNKNLKCWGQYALVLYITMHMILNESTQDYICQIDKYISRSQRKFQWK